MNLFELERERRDRLMQEAEQHRLINQIHPAEKMPNTVLNELGRQMVKLGERLQNL